MSSNLSSDFIVGLQYGLMRLFNSVELDVTTRKDSVTLDILNFDILYSFSINNSYVLQIMVEENNNVIMGISKIGKEKQSQLLDCDLDVEKIISSVSKYILEDSM